jgi:hypothetical protein
VKDREKARKQEGKSGREMGKAFLETGLELKSLSGSLKKVSIIPDWG